MKKQTNPRAFRRLQFLMDHRDNIDQVAAQLLMDHKTILIRDYTG
jgi:hypothetical protein